MLQNLLRKLLLQTPAAKEAAAAAAAVPLPQESCQVVLRPRRGRGRARVASCPVYLDQHRPQQPAARRRCSSSLDLASTAHEEGESGVELETKLKR